MEPVSVFMSVVGVRSRWRFVKKRIRARPAVAVRSWYVGDDLKLLGLLMSSALKSSCAQEADVVRMVMKPHKLVDKP